MDGAADAEPDKGALAYAPHEQPQERLAYVTDLD